MNAKTHFQTGKELHKQENYIGACEQFERAIAIDENYVDAYYYWGLALVNLNEYDQAINKYQRAIAINENYLPAYYSWGLALINLNQYDEAIDKFKQAIAIDQNFLDAYNYWGLALINQKKYDEAIDKFKQAIAIDQNFLDAYNYWGLALINLNQYEEAIDKFERAIAIDPNFVDAYYSWGLALINLNKYEEAIDKFERAIAIDPNFVEAYYNWGLALAELEQYDKAIKKYEQALAIDPNYIAAYNDWRLTLTKLKDDLYLPKVERRIRKIEKLLDEIRRDIELTPLIFSLLQFIFSVSFLILFLGNAYTPNYFIIKIPRNLASFLSLIAGLGCYFSYSSLRNAYTRYRIARRNLIRAISIKNRTKKLLKYIQDRKRNSMLVEKSPKFFPGRVFSSMDNVVSLNQSREKKGVRKQRPVSYFLSNIDFINEKFTGRKFLKNSRRFFSNRISK